METESRRVFLISKIHLNQDGKPTHVLWGEVNPKSNLGVSDQRVVPVAEVIDAIHDGASVKATFLPPRERTPNYEFIVMESAQGEESLALATPHSLTETPVSLQEIARLDEAHLPLDVSLGVGNP